MWLFLAGVSSSIFYFSFGSNRWVAPLGLPFGAQGIAFYKLKSGYNFYINSTFPCLYAQHGYSWKYVLFHEHYEWVNSKDIRFILFSRLI